MEAGVTTISKARWARIALGAFVCLLLPGCKGQDGSWVSSLRSRLNPVPWAREKTWGFFHSRETRIMDNYRKIKGD